MLLENLRDLGDLLIQYGNAPLFRDANLEVTTFRLAGLVFFLFLSWWASKKLEQGMHRLAHRGGNQHLSESGVYALSRILRYTVWIAGSLIALSWLGFDLRNLAIVGGAIGVGVGFGLQNIFSNFISGVIILVEKTLKVGDFVDLQSGVVGHVTEIGMRYTRVTTNDEVDIVVPNSEFINGRVTNWTYTEAIRRIHIPFGVAYGADKEIVREAGITAAKHIKGTETAGARAPDVWLVGFGDSSLNFELVVWVDKALMTAPSRTQAHYLWELETELGNRGIEIPFPQRDIHLRSGRLTVDIAKDEAKPSS